MIILVILICIVTYARLLSCCCSISMHAGCMRITQHCSNIATCARQQTSTTAMYSAQFRMCACIKMLPTVLNIVYVSVVCACRYQVCFDTAAYLQQCHTAQPSCFAKFPFYPSVTVEFEITPAMVHQHFHIPLLLSPYGYSTYRGS